MLVLPAMEHMGRHSRGTYSRLQQGVTSRPWSMQCIMGVRYGVHIEISSWFRSSAPARSRVPLHRRTQPIGIDCFEQHSTGLQIYRFTGLHGIRGKVRICKHSTLYAILIEIDYRARIPIEVWYSRSHCAFDPPVFRSGQNWKYSEELSAKFKKNKIYSNGILQRTKMEWECIP